MRRHTSRRLTAALFVLPWIMAGCLATPDPEPVDASDVVIEDGWTFSPQVIRVTQGTQVNWTNSEASYHTVTFDVLGFDAVLKPGASTSLRFNETGAFDYVCTYHYPEMVGRVLVTSPADPANESAPAHARSHEVTA